MEQEHPLRQIAWSDFQRLAPEDKSPYFTRGGHPYHAIIAQQFDRSFLEYIGSLATKIRRVAKTKGGMNFLQQLLSEKRALLYFAQPSTRTFLSFYSACQILGLQPAEVRDTTTSSELKGESPEDTVRTFSSYTDVIIIRYPEGGFAERIAWILSNTDRPVPVINAGSGKDQHPTQALLDIYTLQRSFERTGGIDGKSIAFVGDLARGRTVRSLALLLTKYDVAKMTFVAPSVLQIKKDLRTALEKAGVPFELTSHLNDVLPQVDAVYMTRIQDEWDIHGESKSVKLKPYWLTHAHLTKLKSDAVVLHPLPRRQEIATEVDADPRAIYWRQVRNGMWIRTALFLIVFERVLEVDRYYEDLIRD